MTTIRSLIERGAAWKQRTFPERQLFLRSEGRVRFVTISSRLQMAGSALIVAVGLWGLVTSIHFIMRDAVLAEKDQKIGAMRTDYHLLSDNFTQLEQDIARRATQLEARQHYLETVIGDSDPAVRVGGETSDITESETNFSDRDKSGESDRDETEDDLHSNVDSNEGISLFNLAAFFSNTDATQAAVQSAPSRAADQAAHLQGRLNMVARSQEAQARTVMAEFDAERRAIDSKLAGLNLRLDSAQLIAAARNQNLPAGGPLYSDADFDMVFRAEEDALFYELNLAEADLNILGRSLGAVPIGRPAKDYYISSLFGRRKDPIRKAVWDNHPGLDLAGWPGTEILATAAGIVIEAGWHGAYGRMIEIDHGNGFRTRFGHMRKLRVAAGDIVDVGQHIGDMGKTGRATDTHLHYEIWFEGKLRNPLPYVKAEADVLQVKAKARTQQGR